MSIIKPPRTSVYFLLPFEGVGGKSWKVLISVHNNGSNFKRLLSVSFHDSFCSANVKHKVKPKTLCQGPGLQQQSERAGLCWRSCPVLTTALQSVSHIMHILQMRKPGLWAGRRFAQGPLQWAPTPCSPPQPHFLPESFRSQLAASFAWSVPAFAFSVQGIYSFPSGLSTFLSSEMSKGHRWSSLIITSLFLCSLWTVAMTATTIVTFVYEFTALRL